MCLKNNKSSYSIIKNTPFLAIEGVVYNISIRSRFLYSRFLHINALIEFPTRGSVQRNPIS